MCCFFFSTLLASVTAVLIRNCPFCLPIHCFSEMGMYELPWQTPMPSSYEQVGWRVTLLTLLLHPMPPSPATALPLLHCLCVTFSLAPVHLSICPCPPPPYCQLTTTPAWPLFCFQSPPSCHLFLLFPSLKCLSPCYFWSPVAAAARTNRQAGGRQEIVRPNAMHSRGPLGAPAHFSGLKMRFFWWCFMRIPPWSQIISQAASSLFQK